MWGGALGNHRGGATYFTTLWLYVGGGLVEGTLLVPGFWRFAQHLPHFQSLYPLPLCDLCPSSCCPFGESQSGWVCVCSKTVWALEVESTENPEVSSTAPTPTDFYSQKLWEFMFLVLEP